MLAMQSVCCLVQNCRGGGGGGGGGKRAGCCPSLAGSLHVVKKHIHLPLSGLFLIPVKI